jgi:hypothetical protein
MIAKWEEGVLRLLESEKNLGRKRVVFKLGVGWPAGSFGP